MGILLVNGRLDLEMKQELLPKPRHSPSLKVLGTRFLNLLLKKEVKLRLRRLILLISCGQDSLLLSKRTVWKQPTLCSSRMPHLKMPVFMSCLVLTELVILSSKDLLLLSPKSHPSPNPLQISPPPLDLLLPLLLVLLVFPC